MMAGFPPPMGGPPGRGGPTMGGRGPPGMGGPSFGGRPQPGGGMGGQSYNANNPPGGQFSVPNAGNTGEQPRARGLEPDARGLGALASGVSTPMDKYGMPERPRRPGGYNDGGRGGYGERGGLGPDPRFDERRSARGGDGRPQNLRYEERDYGEYVTNLRTMGGDRGRGDGPPPGPGGGGGGDFRNLEDEVERLRKENDMLKRSCQDLMNNFNELSNRLFDVDESLKKVAKVFPSEDEMESLEWLLRR